MPRGGKRQNAGRKKTFEGVCRAEAKVLRAQAVLTKEAAREFICQRVYAEIGALVDAQIANGKGIFYLVVRQKSTGKFLRRVGATDEKTHDADTEIIEVWEKDPSTPAFIDLMNRVVDKPAEQPHQVKVEHTIRLEDLVVGLAPPVALLEA